MSAALATAPADAAPVLGIDLETRRHEVESLVLKWFGEQIRREGWDKREVLQEVFKALLVRNRGRCPFDPRKASFGYYVMTVAKCALVNYFWKTVRVRTHEKVGIFAYAPTEHDRAHGVGDTAGLHRVRVDAATRAVGGIEDERNAAADLQRHLTRAGHDKAANVLGLVVEGRTEREIAKAMGWSLATTREVMAQLRESTRAWAED